MLLQQNVSLMLNTHRQHAEAETTDAVAATVLTVAASLVQFEMNT
jgi:hypothetical protein